jgi:hypothetical protein
MLKLEDEDFNKSVLHRICTVHSIPLKESECPSVGTLPLIPTPWFFVQPHPCSSAMTTATPDN